MELKDRVRQYCNHAKITIAAFERLAKLSNGYFNQVQKAPSLSKLSQISQAFPDLNTNWLLTGEGEMLTTDRDGHTIESDAIETTKLNDMNITRLLDTIERQGRQIDEMLEQNGRLISIIETLAGTSKQSRVG